MNSIENNFSAPPPSPQPEIKPNIENQPNNIAPSNNFDVESSENFSEQPEKNQGKEQRLDEIRQDVENTGDRLGKPIDEGIKETVVMFQANELPTSGSCEGHVESGLPVPYVDVSAPNEPAERFVGENEVFEKVAKKYNVSAEEVRTSQIEDAYWEAMKESSQNEETEEYKKWNEENERLLRKGHNLLDEFYKERQVEPNAKLEIEEGVGGFRIHNGGEDYNPVIEEKREFTEQEKKIRTEKVEKYRAEMNEFTEFLKGKYFENDEKNIKENIEKQTEEKSEQAENTPEEKIKKVEDEISVKQQAIEGLRNRIAERKKALEKIREKIGLAPTEEITGCALDDVQELRQAHEDLEVLKNKLLDQVFSGIYGMERDTWKEKFTATLNKDMPANISSESVLREDPYLPKNDMVDIGIQWHNNEEDDALAIESHLMWFYKEKKLVIEKIRSKNKQKGLGKLASKNIIELARVIGAEKVALLAGEENGPYFWARMGFLPDAKGVQIYDWQGLSSTDYANKEHLRDVFLSFLKMHLANQNISQETYDSLQTSLNTKDDGSWLWDIVDSIDPMKQGDRTVPLGKGSWIPKYHGVFDLANTKQQKRLDDYTRQKNKSE